MLRQNDRVEEQATVMAAVEEVTSEREIVSNKMNSNTEFLKSNPLILLPLVERKKKR